MHGIYEEMRLALHAIWLRRWIALAVAAGICLVGWTIIGLIPNTYESQARVFVQMQSLLPTKMGITENEKAKDVERVRQTLSSSVNLEKVVRGTSLAKQATSDREVAALVETLRQNITIKAQQDNLVEISAKASAGGLSDGENARLAQAITAKLIDIFVEENIAGDRNETGQTLTFLDQQLAERQRALQQIEQKRAEFNIQYASALPGSGTIEDRMDAARTELAQIEQQLIAAQSSLAALNGQMATTAPTIAIPGGGGSVVVGGARGRMAALEGQLADAQSRGWTDQHPDVVAIRQQMARTAGAASAQVTGGGGGGSTPNPLFVTLRTMQAEKQGTAAALSARKAQLNAELGAITARMTSDPAFADEQSRLDRDYQVLKAQYDKLLGDREDVRLRSDVATKTDSIQFRVIDPPSAPRVPVAPKRPLLLALVLIVGIGAGAGVAFAMAQLKPTYATADRLARASGMPVLGSIGESLTETIVADRRQKLVWFGGASGALAGLFALLLIVEFIQRGLV